MIALFQTLADEGKAVELRGGTICAHTPTTRQYTTSRCKYYVQVDRLDHLKVPDAMLECWPAHHPTTRLEDLKFVVSGELVCVAARLVGPAPTKKNVSASGEELQVTNAMIREDRTVVQCTAWREASDRLETLVVGQLYFFDAVKVNKSQDGSGSVSLVVVGQTKILPCPESIAAKLSDTPSTMEEGDHMTKLAGKGFKDVTQENAKWCSVSMINCLMHPNVAQVGNTVYRVPSSTVTVTSTGLAYRGCAVCKKAVQNGALWCNCARSGQEPKCYWKANISVADITAQVNGTMFDAVADFKPLFEKFKFHVEFIPENFLADDEQGVLNTEEAVSLIAAIPMTVLIELADGRQAGRQLDLIVRNLRPTMEEKVEMLPVLPRIPLETSTRIPLAPLAKTGACFAQLHWESN